MSSRRQGSATIYGVYGNGGFGREVMPVLEMMLRAREEESGFDLVFIDDAPTSPQLNGRRVLTFEEFIAEKATKRSVSIAVSSFESRVELDAKCRDNRIEFVNVVAPNAIIMDDVQMGEGAILSPFVTVTSNVRIGRHFHANIYSSIAHDCRIGDFVTFAPGVRCNGNVTIHDNAYLGTDCVLRPGKPGDPLEIGEGAVVGMGAVVTKSVPPGVTVIGNPARPF